MSDKCKGFIGTGLPCSRQAAFRCGGYCKQHWIKRWGHKYVGGICVFCKKSELVLGRVCHSRATD